MPELVWNPVGYQMAVKYFYVITRNVATWENGPLEEQSSGETYEQKNCFGIGLNAST